MYPQKHAPEIYLLENYISLTYLGELRDTWATMVEHLETCLNEFMYDLQANYRSRPLPEQPDVVWGNRVLPNFRDTLQGLHQGFILLTHGDFKGLTSAHGPCNDFKGQMDYWSGWMSKADEDLYAKYLNRSVEIAHNIVLTEGAYWDELPLSHYVDGLVPISKPARWPAYRISQTVRVQSGKKTGKSGIYVADVPQSCAQFLSANHAAAPFARVRVGHQDLLHPTTGEKYDEQLIFEERPCVWYLVERGEEQGKSTEYGSELQSGRVVAGETCPRTGYYFTPARMESRRVFQEGELMPDVESPYRIAIWQWDSSQS